MSEVVSLRTSGTGADVAPPGATSCRIRVRGGGAGGGDIVGGSTPCATGGGGAGGYCERTIAVSPGNSFNYSVAAAAIHSQDGNASTVTGSVAGGPVNMTANGGNAGPDASTGEATGGLGGSASGGTINTTGGAGSNGLLSSEPTIADAGEGGNAPDGGGTGGAGGVAITSGNDPGDPGSAPGGGGGGAARASGSGTPQGGEGARGEIEFIYTVSDRLMGQVWV